jgi:hypothetical protein
VALLKSGSDANTYLVGDASDPLQRSLMDLELKDHLLASGHPHALAAGAPRCPAVHAVLLGWCRRMHRVAGWMHAPDSLFALVRHWRHRLRTAGSRVEHSSRSSCLWIAL